jgi:DNA-binding transcriptional ArsR family regulator
VKTSVFGSPLRDRILLLLSLIGDSYPSELADKLDAPLFSVQRTVDALQNSGIVASRPIGTIRSVQLDRTWYAARELRVLLTRMTEAHPDMKTLAASVRRRPRRAGKTI